MSRGARLNFEASGSIVFDRTLARATLLEPICGAAIGYTDRKLKVLDHQMLESFSWPCYQVIRNLFDFAPLIVR